MDAVKFIEERSRMCKSFNKCSYGCPAWGGSCKLETGTYLECEAEKQVEIVEAWSAAHTRKTRQDLFLEQYPNAKTSEKGTLYICPIYVDKNTTIKYSCICSTNCSDCRREFWMQEVE